MGKEINFNDFKVRCSAINKVLSNSRANPVLTENQEKEMADLEDKLQKKGLTEKQQEKLAELKVKEKNGKKIILSDTCIKYLMEDYAFVTEGMIPVGKEALDLVAIKKGNKTELTSAFLLTKVDGVPYSIHKDRIYNEYLSGQIDLYVGESVMNAKIITDIKQSSDYPIFLSKIHTGLENGQEEQVQGYMDITGAPEGYIANILVDYPEEMIEAMRWTLTRKLGAATPESPEVLDVWPTWEHSMRFSKIPEHKRVHKIKINPFSDFERQRLYDRVNVCREWLYNFHEQYQKINLQ